MVDKIGIKTKMDAVERFSFIKQIYSKVRDSGFTDDEGNNVDMCGVIISGRYAYATNNHFIGRIYIPDGNPPDYARYWDFKEENEMNAIKEPPIAQVSGGNDGKHQQTLFYNFNTDEWQDNMPYDSFIQQKIKVIKQFFFNWRDNLVKFDKDILLGEMDKFFKRNVNDKMRYALFMRAYPEAKTILCKLLKISKDDVPPYEFEIPMHIAPGRTPEDDYAPPGICSVNCFYMYYILQAFKEYSIVDLCFDNNHLVPVILKGVNPRVEWKPDIRFAIAQVVPKYKFPERDLY